MIKIVANTLALTLILSFPTVGFAAWYFQNPDLLWYLAIPFIIIMAGGIG